MKLKPTQYVISHDPVMYVRLDLISYINDQYMILEGVICRFDFVPTETVKSLQQAWSAQFTDG